MKTFLQWINEERRPEGSPLAATHRKPIKVQRDRDRLTRIEAMLTDLIQRRTNHAHEN